MEKYISIPNADSSKPNVLISISNILSIRKSSDTSVNIQYKNKATSNQIQHNAVNSTGGDAMTEWLIANVLRANNRKSMITEVSDPPFDITGFYLG